MTDFTVAVSDLLKDAARFDELSDRFSTFGTVMGAVSAAAVDDWGFWESYKAAVDTVMSATAPMPRPELSSSRRRVRSSPPWPRRTPRKSSTTPTSQPTSTEDLR